MKLERAEKQLFNQYEELLIKFDKTSEENRYLKYEFKLLKKQMLTLQKKENTLEEEIKQAKAENNNLQKEVNRLTALLNNDGTNSGIPTSMTPLSKNKVIPNSRVKTDKKIGGQPGHKKHKLDKFTEEEVTEILTHALDTCPNCNEAELIKTSSIYKDELDYKVVVDKIRHEFEVYECQSCGKGTHYKIPKNLKMENQYGPSVQALSLTLMNQGNVAINKVRKIISGFTNGEINLSEGYIAKLQNRAAKNLETFNEELRLEMIKQKVVHWDDTVIMINKKQSCLRYYGNEILALYKAHLKKDKEGRDKDNILKLLPSDATVVHDHLKENYNAEYSYQNSECNAHLLRDLQKVSDNMSHSWSEELRKLLNETNAYRKELINDDKESFSEEEVKDFFDKFDKIMIKSFKENEADNHKYYSSKEKSLITRILDYKNEYLGWVLNFELPFTNNLSERSLRGVKSKMKISGQFQNEKSAGYYASIKSYIETCYRNGINEYNALLHLCLEQPLKLEEVIKKES